MLITIEHMVQNSIEKHYKVDFITTLSTTIVKKIRIFLSFSKHLPPHDSRS